MPVAYNNEPAEEKNELWQRQLDVLKQLTEAENTVYKAMDMMNPVYDAELGRNKNVVVTTMMLTGCQKILSIVAPQLSDNKEEGGGRGITSHKYERLQNEINKAQAQINKAIGIDTNSLAGQKTMQEAYNSLYILFLVLRQTTNDLGYDFKPKPSVYDAWRE